jgi:hypothetical protein
LFRFGNRATDAGCAFESPHDSHSHSDDGRRVEKNDRTHARTHALKDRDLSDRVSRGLRTGEREREKRNGTERNGTERGTTSGSDEHTTTTKTIHPSISFVLFMAQGLLNKGKKSVAGHNRKKLASGNLKAANRHGKVVKQRKGKFNKPPKGSTEAAKQNRAITRDVNLKNELEFSRKATSSGGTLRVLKAPEGSEIEIRGPKPKKRAPTVVKTPAQLQAEKKASKWSY